VRKAASIRTDLSSKDITLSVILHVMIVASTFLPVTFASRPDTLGNVISVRLISAPPLPVQPDAPPQPIKPLTIPKAMEAEPEVIPIDDPVTAKPVKIPETKPAPVKKPEQKKPDKTQKNLDAVTGDTRRAGTADGSTDVEVSASGSPFAGARVDNASFDYPYWFDLAFTQIANNFQNPINTDAKLVCVVYFQVIRSGRVLEIKVQTPSGVPAFDDACVAAIERSKPFTPLPREFRDEIIGITVPFTNR
jgi:TonB family protein